MLRYKVTIVILKEVKGPNLSNYLQTRLFLLTLAIGYFCGEQDHYMFIKKLEQFFPKFLNNKFVLQVLQV